jgi:predicted alpha/beta superfamily hydrolase
MKYKSLLATVLLFNIFLYAQDAKITFMVSAYSLVDSCSVYITGNDVKLGEWDPALIKLNKDEGNIRKIELSFPTGTKLEYKFTLGEWNMEALNESGESPNNSLLIVEKDTTVSVIIKHWGSGAPRRNPFHGQITGDVRYHRNFKGEGLLPRDIIVWLPPSYEKEKHKRYPVLYAQDGQNLFDPLTSSFGVDWQLDETADSLIRQGKIHEIIIVGIYNTPERRKEYYTGDTGKSYMKFIAKELKPFIDKTYRTLPDRRNTASLGSSAGGLFSFILVWEYNDIFSKAACISPAFYIRGIDYVTPVLMNKGKRRDFKIYIDCGGVGLDSLLLDGAEKMVSALKGRGYKKGKDYFWFFDKTGEHNEQNWARRLWRPLEFFYGTK